jgi:hypothetical protein
VVFVWDRGQAHACGSCYSDGQLLLAGAPEDTDEFDDAVILHELGHLIVDHLGRDDSPGGSHDGSRTDPLVAYGEGVATAFALLVLDNSLYIDTNMSGVRAYENLERAPYLEAYGTSNGALTGQVSEWMVAALIWDLADPASPDEPFDRLAVPLEAIWRVYFEGVRDLRRPDLGFPGMDLADWLDTFRVAHAHLAEALEQLVGGHHSFPMTPVGKLKREFSGWQ